MENFQNNKNLIENPNQNQFKMNNINMNMSDESFNNMDNNFNDNRMNRNNFNDINNRMNYNNVNDNNINNNFRGNNMRNNNIGNNIMNNNRINNMNIMNNMINNNMGDMNSMNNFNNKMGNNIGNNFPMNGNMQNQNNINNDCQILKKGPGLTNYEIEVIINSTCEALNRREEPLSKGIIKRIKTNLGGDWVVFAYIDGLKGYDLSVSTYDGDKVISYVVDNFRFEVINIRV